jgi:TetR/AcrR family acrAB operon transcriptional repressor
MVRKTKEEALETRERLLDASGRVFCAKGVTNTSLAEIAEAAGVTRGAIYWHFKNKTDLIEALWKRTEMPVDESWSDECCHPCADPLARIRLQAVDMLRRAMTDNNTRQIWDILFHKSEHVDDAAALKTRLLASREDCAANVERVFRAAIEAGQLPANLDVRTAIIGLFCYIEGLIYNWLLDPDALRLDERAELYVDIYLSGLKHQSVSG